MLDRVTYRNHRPGDTESMVKLINEADAADKLERTTTLEQLEHEMSWPNYDAGSDCFLAWAGDELVGYADLFMRRATTGDDTPFSSEESKFYTWGVVHPAWRRRGVGKRLMELLHQRASDRLCELNGRRVFFQAQARDVETGRIALLASFGLEPVRYGINMARRLDGELPPVKLPHGYTLRLFDPQTDVQTVWKVQNLAFQDHWGYSVFPLEEFRHVLDEPDFRPELWLLAIEQASGTIVGLGLSWIEPQWIESTGRQEGTIGTLGVLREHRRRGVGTALLVQSMRTLQAYGMDWAQLGADADNLTGAVRLYERVGFTVRKTYITYRKALRDAQESDR